MSRSKAKGTRWESAIVRLLVDEGFMVERRALTGCADRGDISGLDEWVIEAKDCVRTELAAWVDEAAVEQANAGARYAAVWHHRRGKGSPADGFVTMRGDVFVRLLQALEGGDAS